MNDPLHRHLNRLKPLSQLEIDFLRPLIDKHREHFIFTNMLTRYIALQEFVLAGGLLQLSDSERKRFEKESEGLKSWLPLRLGQNMDHETAVEEVLGWAAIDGYLAPDRVALRDSLSPKKKGVKRTPESAEITIAALEMYLSGKTDNEIADVLPHECKSRKPHRDDYATDGNGGRVRMGENTCAGDFRKRRKELSSFLEDCGWELVRNSRK